MRLTRRWEDGGTDVVVVGGGAAGCVVSARLAEADSRSVLLLEAGPDRRGDMPFALRDGWTIEREMFDWGYVSAADPPKPVRRKRVLGGTSWLTRFTPRGAPADYDGWAARGLPSWGWEDVLPYFVKLEADVDFGDRPWHGDSGPIPSTRHLDLDFADVTNGCIDALDAAGFRWVDDTTNPAPSARDNANERARRAPRDHGGRVPAARRDADQPDHPPRLARRLRCLRRHNRSWGPPCRRDGGRGRTRGALRRGLRQPDDPARSASAAAGHWSTCRVSARTSSTTLPCTSTAATQAPPERTRRCR